MLPKRDRRRRHCLSFDFKHQTKAEEEAARGVPSCGESWGSSHFLSAAEATEKLRSSKHLSFLASNAKVPALQLSLCQSRHSGVLALPSLARNSQDTKLYPSPFDIQELEPFNVPQELETIDSHIL
jgi:hypothetical protein